MIFKLGNFIYSSIYFQFTGTIVATGRVIQPEDQKFLKLQHIIDETMDADLPQENIKLLPSDVYKELRVRGYDYGKSFRLIQEAEDEGHRGKVAYTGQWISFADNLLQLSILYQKNRALMYVFLKLNLNFKS